MGEVREVHGRKVGVVRFDLTELIDHEPDAIHEQMSSRLVRHGRLVDLDYRVVGCLDHALYIEVSGVEEPEHVGPPDDVLSRIAAETFGIESLEVRGSDRLDFHALGVAAIREALAAAYEAGRGSSR